MALQPGVDLGLRYNMPPGLSVPFSLGLRYNMPPGLSVPFSLGLRYNMPPGLSVPFSLGLRYNMPPGLSVPFSISPFVYTHLSQVHGHVIQPSYSWSFSTSCCIQLSLQHLFFGIAVSCILSIYLSYLILWYLINLTMFSPLIMASNSSFCRVFFLIMYFKYGLWTRPQCEFFRIFMLVQSLLRHLSWSNGKAWRLYMVETPYSSQVLYSICVPEKVCCWFNVSLRLHIPRSLNTKSKIWFVVGVKWPLCLACLQTRKDNSKLKKSNPNRFSLFGSIDFATRRAYFIP